MKKSRRQNIEILNIAPEKSSLRTMLLGILCAALFGSGLCFGISKVCVELSVVQGIICAAAAALGYLLSAAKPFKKLYPLVPAAAAVLFAVVDISGCIEGFSETFNKLIVLWNGRYGDAIELFSSAKSGGFCFTAVVILLIAAVADLLVLLNRAGISEIVVAIVILPAFVLGCISPVGAGLFFIGLLVQKAYRCGRDADFRKFCWIAAGVVILLVAVVSFRSEYTVRVNEVREEFKQTLLNVRYGEDTLPEGDLSKAYLMNTDDEERLVVKQSHPSELYLRGFIGAEYSDGKWTVLERSNFRGSNEGITEWLKSNGFEPFRQYSDYISADGTKLAKNKVTVKNTGADRGYVYLPYSASSVNTKVVSVRDGAAWATGVFGKSSYNFTETSTKYPGELLYPDEWLTSPVNETQKTYAENEEIYRTFVYKTCLDVDKELKDKIDEMFVKTADSSVEKTVYNVTQHIHRVLESCSYYSEKPSAPTASEPIAEFLDGGTGNSAMYASAAVQAYRAFGIPARYVEGYYVNGATAGAEATLTSKNAHAWAEVYIDGLGWVPVDVTPGYYHDVYTLMDMVEHPQDINKTAALEDNDQHSNAIQDKSKKETRPDAIGRTVRSVGITILGTLATVLIIAAAVLATAEISSAALVKDFRKKLEKADNAEKQRAACEMITRLLKCIGIELYLGWNAADTEKEIISKTPTVSEGEFMRVNQLMEKHIYGGEELQPYEVRVLLEFMNKLMKDKDRKLSIKERFRVRYVKPPKI